MPSTRRSPAHDPVLLGESSSCSSSCCKLLLHRPIMWLNVAALSGHALEQEDRRFVGMER